MISSANAAALTTPPVTSENREPNRAEIRPASIPITNIVAVLGSRYRPESTTEAPNPKPVERGSCTNCGITMNDEYIPAPSRNAARFVVHTPRTRIISMSTSG